MDSTSKEQVVAVKRNTDGDIIEFKFSSGNTADYKTAQDMVRNKQIENLNLFKGRDGDDHIRSHADGDPSNNLDALPTYQ